MQCNVAHIYGYHSTRHSQLVTYDELTNAISGMCDKLTCPYVRPYCVTCML